MELYKSAWYNMAVSLSDTMNLKRRAATMDKKVDIIKDADGKSIVVINDLHLPDMGEELVKRNASCSSSVAT